MIRNTPPNWLYRRPRILNILHFINLATPHSQMNLLEKECLEKHATGKHSALEIGTYMGVTASIIACALAKNGVLFCVDPFELRNNRQNPGLLMTIRGLKRAHVFNKVKFLFGFSNEQTIIEQIPPQLDFILVDGDHSYEGLENDWEIVLSKLIRNGVVCFHDTTIPKDEPYRDFGSVKYFNEVIKFDQRFEHLETVYSMNVLLRK